MAKELMNKIIEGEFTDNLPVILGTGGFEQLFGRQNLFDHIVPDLILEVLKEIV